MFILIPTALVLIIMGLAPPKYGLRQNNYKSYMIIGGILIALVMGLRYRYTGSPDTWAYTVIFDNLKKYDDFWDYYDFYLGDAEFVFSEWGFFYCAWLLTRVFEDGQILIFVTSVFVTFSTCLFIRKNSSDSALALIIYVCLGMFTFNMNGMRQAVAMSVCLFSFEYAKKRQIIRYALIVFLAIQFHKSALFFAPVFFLPMLKNTKGNWLIYVIGMIVFMAVSDQMIPWFNDMTGKEYTDDNAATGGGIFVILMYLCGVVLALACPQALEKPAAKVGLFGSVVGLTSYITRYIYNDMMERLSYYYFYFLILLIPEVINELSEEEEKVVKSLFLLFAFALFSYRVYNSGFKDFTFFFFK